ncbi:retrotransposon-like protein 1 [Elysia marginata]|uniref:Retrotransposon-like protein 1 n=1 Tax=Elysia marginata TaxID=1093978 RepID=A0AAV4IHJ0_9GAST|nr:retrotransposon-like protein 1 [Elysia marginata]
MYVCNFGRGDKWIRGEIVESTGPVSYKVKTDENVVRRHADHVRVTCAEDECESDTPTDFNYSPPTVTVQPRSMVFENGEKENGESSKIDGSRSNSKELGVDLNDQIPGSPIQKPLRRSEGKVKAPDRLDL